MTATCRSEARSVILRLRHYRDRVQGIVSAVAGEPAMDGRGAIVLQRQIRSLKSDLDNEAHECAIHRRRMVQTECEHEFLWPALREAADAICQRCAVVAVDAGLRAELSDAQSRIQCYLTQLEGRWPTL